MWHCLKFHMNATLSHINQCYHHPVHFRLICNSLIYWTRITKDGNTFHMHLLFVYQYHTRSLDIYAEIQPGQSLNQYGSVNHNTIPNITYCNTYILSTTGTLTWSGSMIRVILPLFMCYLWVAILCIENFPRIVVDYLKGVSSIQCRIEWLSWSLTNSVILTPHN